MLAAEKVDPRLRGDDGKVGEMTDGRTHFMTIKPLSSLMA
jgi:hypothetical protein